MTGYKVSLVVEDGSIKASISNRPILKATDNKYLTGRISLVITDSIVTAN